MNNLTLRSVPVIIFHRKAIIIKYYKYVSLILSLFATSRKVACTIPNEVIGIFH
jgi:hypothetical protein